MIDNIIYLVMFAGIGGIIGGSTNMLAIRMLFRPYKPIYIGSLRLPFTPGVIPGKHKQLAQKIALVVTEYILTPQAISNALMKAGFQTAVKANLLNNWSQLSNNQTPIGKFLDNMQVERHNITEYLAKIIRAQLVKANKKSFIEAKLDQLTDQYGDWQLEVIIPDAITTSVEANIEQAIPYIQKYISKHLQEPQTKIALIQLLDESLSVKNPLLRKLLFGIIGDEQIQQQIIDKLQKMIESEAIKLHLEKYLRSEWDHFMSSTFNELTIKWPTEYQKLRNIISRSLHKLIQQGLHSEQLSISLNQEIAKLIDNIWNTPIASVYIKADPYINNVIDWAVDKALRYIEQHVDEILTNFNMTNIIEEQIVSFDPATLEKMILQVAKRELQYITFLGFFLGGIIGVFQYLITYNTLP